MNKFLKEKKLFGKILSGVIIIYLVASFFSSKVKKSDLSIWATGDKRGLLEMDVDNITDNNKVNLAMPKMKTQLRNKAISRVVNVSVEDGQAGVNEKVDENVDKKNIKIGRIVLKVENADQEMVKVIEMAQRLGGDIYSSRSNNATQGQKKIYLTVKVPVDKFSEAMDNIKQFGDQVIFVSMNTNDVTEKYVDLQAQLKNKKLEEKTFQDLLERSGKLDDILKITKEISRVRGEVERLEGRIRFMNSQTDMSVINVVLTELPQIIPDKNSWRPWQVVKESLRELIISLQNLVDDVIRFMIVKLPFLLIITLVIFAGYKVLFGIYRRFK